MLTREFLANVPRPGQPEKFHVKAWGVDTFLVDPTCDLVDEWETFCEAHKGEPKKNAAGQIIEDGKPLPGPWRATFASIVLCDDKGKRVFTAEDVPTLGALSPEGLREIWEAGIGRFKTNIDAEVEAAAGN